MKRSAGALLLAALLVPAPLLAAGPAGRAGAAGVASFNATAAAQAMRTTVVVPRLLVAETLADGGGLVSQAELTSVGGRAFASSVYPGDPATAGQAAGAAGLPRPPDSPLYVAAAHPTAPKATASPPGQEMSAEADESSATGRATAGAARPAATPDGADGVVVAAAVSTARAEQQPGGSVVARAESLIDGAMFPGGLTIAHVRSAVTTTYRPGAAPEVEAVTAVTGAAVNGTPVGIGPDGITAPAPAGLPAGTLTPLEEQLRKAGTSVRRIGGAPVAGGGSADVIEVRTTATPPVPGLPEGIVIWRLAGATAAVTAGDSGADPVDLAAPGVPADFPSPGSGSVPSPTPPQAAPEGVPSAPVFGGVGPSSSAGPTTPASGLSSGPTGGAELAEGFPSAVAGSQPASGEALADPLTGSPDRIRPAAFDRGGLGTLRARYGLLYLVMILAAVAGFAASAVFRTKGAHARWS